MPGMTIEEITRYIRGDILRGSEVYGTGVIRYAVSGVGAEPSACTIGEFGYLFHCNNLRIS